jgi:catechol 2,3-dioxygenase-like lactoylglutathione lyase family enzyme
MLSQFSYPMICTDNFEQTVAFYEDYFEFMPSLEMEGFVILSRETWQDMYLAVIDCNHTTIPEKFRKPVSGMILNFPTEDVKATYEKLYDEGLDIVSEPEDAKCGRKHFFVEDPNGILIDVAEEVDMEKLMSPEELKDLCFVA